MELDMDITPYNYKKNKQLSPFLSAKLSGNVLNRVFAQNCDLLVGRGRVAVHWVINAGLLPGHRMLSGHVNHPHFDFG